MFLAIAVVLLIVALTSSRDEGAEFGWLGVCAAFLTAGLVDLFGLLEGRRRRAEFEKRLAPVRAAIIRDLGWQRRDLLGTVKTLLPVEGEIDDWAQQLWDHEEWLITPGDPADVYPTRNKATYVSELLVSMQSRQSQLEARAAGGILTVEVAAMSELVLRGTWQAVLSTVHVMVGKSNRGTATFAAQAMEDLLAIEIPSLPASTPKSPPHTRRVQ